MNPAMGGMMAIKGPRIIPNPLDNSLLIQGTPQEYQSVLKLLKELDIPPRQILLEAKIYEVSLTGAFAMGVSAYLQSRNPNTTGRVNSSRDFAGALTGAAVQLQAGALVGASRELLAFLNLQENATRSKVISAPSLIATDSIAASINVGNEVPTLTSTTASGITTGGNTQFAQNISSRNTGVTLNVMARVNPSGIVTLIINQEVSAPQPPQAGGIPSPSFSKRTVQTQITMQDGDTIAIGGIINETNSSASAGIPILHRLPIVGSAFGSRSYSRERTELIIFMTPRVIYDTNQMVEASDELRSRLRRLNKMVKE
jgi:general secretion pathway protein D